VTVARHCRGNATKVVIDLALRLASKVFKRCKKMKNITVSELQMHAPERELQNSLKFPFK
jgi:dihydroneopterin aldolase